ncbi:hypothetical protein DICPUDRAFT_154982 [Dictyostelium purpureum]|uniref:Sulfotransferase domain-containing protein n=1 Tax=Dictyostelium purpureum TaxID=5786 RepID=F0ZSR9_DICPU|nr:uncharacterized protein DICPUDRAFT_154982 [Dictyostelium purpureum]EGC32993.1 hypothetical protein DICPUDRAFT_154982 [Dictyostelium purpureum]|eukprot:XP_003290463.1 hypothetical protein DICPUDRAFT_154982 [Dictyostelium purpureum]
MKNIYFLKKLLFVVILIVFSLIISYSFNNTYKNSIKNFNNNIKISEKEYNIIKQDVNNSNKDDNNDDINSTSDNNNLDSKEKRKLKLKEWFERKRYYEQKQITEMNLLKNHSIRECRKEINYLDKHDITPTIASLKLIPGYPGPREPYTNNNEYLDNEWKKSSLTNRLLLPKPYIFIHMPKTGGTSLLKVFRNNNRNLKFYYSNVHPPYQDLKNVVKKDTLFGHFVFGLHKYFDKHPETRLQLPKDIVEPYLNQYSYLTMLRDPIDRAISHYYFLKASFDHPLHHQTINKTFIEWISITDTVNNEFCRRMVGIDRSTETTVDFENLCIHRLKYTFKYIGIMERFDESIVLLSHKLGYTDLLFPNENVGKVRTNHTKETLTQEERSLLERLNTADIRAYKIALEIFEKEIDMVGRDFLNQEVIQFKKKYNEEYNIT